VSGWGSNQPTGLIQSVSTDIGSGNSTALIAPTANGVRLLSLTISSGAVSVGGGIGTSFLVSDTVTDTNGVQYGSVEIGLPQGAPFATHNSAVFDLAGIVMPAGAELDLNNGGAAGTGALRRCSASVTYIIL